MADAQNEKGAGSGRPHPVWLCLCEIPGKTKLQRQQISGGQGWREQSEHQEAEV